jgi:HD-GYP domain-containing protein (c-di-GMP phosphodiesterase class II)
MNETDVWASVALDLLTELAVGVMTCCLYSGEHPRAERARQRVAGRFGELFNLIPSEETESGGETTLELAVLQNELFFHGRPFTRSGEQMGILVRLLGQHLIERVNFEAGVDRDEIGAFIDGLARLDPGSFPAFDHIRVSRVVSIAGIDDPQSGRPQRELDPNERTAVMLDVVEAVASEQVLPWAHLHGVVDQLDRQVQQSTRPLELLAPLGEDRVWPAVHAHNAAVLSLALAAPLGQSAVQRHDIGVAAALHDIGKFGLALEYIQQDLELEGLEWELSFDHTRIGLERLLADPQSPEIAQVVAFDHHLRQDGSGYPHLEEPRPPHRAAALVSVAEAFDVVHTVRWSRGAIDQGEVGAFIRQGGSEVFDPLFAGVMLSIWEGFN